MKKIFLFASRRKAKSVCILSAAAVCLLSAAAVLPGCKAWRTVSTSATYVQQNDSAQTKTTTTISTKTVEEYQGVKKK